MAMGVVPAHREEAVRMKNRWLFQRFFQVKEQLLQLRKKLVAGAILRDHLALYNDQQNQKSWTDRYMSWNNYICLLEEQKGQ